MNRHTAITILFILICSCTAMADHIVAVTAEKEIEIQNQDTAAARTMALALAARDAVEKAFGAYINVKEMPEGRQILQKAAADLRYVVLAEQQRKGRYWVKIQANVTVPDEYAGSSEEERESLGQTMKNFVQKYPQGEINWGDGFMTAYGKGEMTAGSANAEAKAARAAEVDAKAHLLEMINDIALDDRTKTGQQKRLSFAIEGFVQGAQVVTQSKAGTMVNVTVQAPIRGVKGLTMALYGSYTLAPPPPAPEKKPAPLRETRKFTGVVIDARKVSITPAIFPKIQDSQKREIHTVSEVNKEDLQKRGMASYAVVSRDVQISKLFPRALILPVGYVPATPAKSRQGEQPLVVEALDVAGDQKTDPVISEDQAGSLQTTDALKECRLVIVLSSEP